MFRRFTLISCVLVGLIFFIVPAQAFTISPLRFLVTIDPGSSQTVAVDIKNNENADITVKPVVLGARQNAKGRTEFLSGVNQAEGWVKADVGSFAIAKNETKKINFTVSAPSMASPGSYYLAVGAQQAGSGGQIGLSGRLLTLLTVQVAGTAQEKLTINKWQAAQYFIVKKVWPFQLEIKNSGNVEVSYRAVAIVRNWSGDEKMRYTLVEKENILAGTDRSDNYSVDVEGQYFWPGLYQVQAQVDYGLTGQTVTAMVYIIYFPVWAWVVLGLIILCVIGAFTSQYKFQM